MSFLQIAVLAVIQGLAELLPVSSSAHVIVAEHFMKLDPSSPEMTFLLVMLHTGTMLAVVLYFWKRWKELLCGSAESRNRLIKNAVVATVVTGVIGLVLKTAIEHLVLGGGDKAEIEALFGNLYLIAGSLAVVGVIILVAGLLPKKVNASQELKPALAVGAIQGLCLPFRGFSRSGSTISVALLSGMSQRYAEEFSFILAVILTPPVILKELHRLLKNSQGASLSQLLLPGAFGLVLSFVAGLLAIRWLSRWLETGKWYLFGIYCLLFSALLLGFVAKGIL